MEVRYGSNFVFIAQGWINLILHTLINWLLRRGYYASLGRVLVVVAIVERWPLYRG